MSVKIIYFVHGTTTDNIEHKATGWQPGILSEKGINQSIELGKKIDIEQIDIVFCSDLERAVESAKYIFEGRKQIIQDKRLRECNYGDLNGKETNLVKYEEHINNAFPNGESLVDVEKRVKDFCDFLLEKYNGKTVAIVAHKAPQFAFQVITQNISWGEAINNDWRKTKSWKPGWEYIIEEYKQEILEKCLPSYLKSDINKLKEGIKNNVSYLDCLINEVQGSVNSAWTDGDITEEQCDYLYNKYIRMEK